MGKKRGQHKETKKQQARDEEPEATNNEINHGRRLLSLTRLLQSTSSTPETYVLDCFSSFTIVVLRFFGAR
jgi:hypothetical protein